MEGPNEKIFSPYKVDSIGKDHVRLSRGGRTYMRIFYFVFPVVLLIITGVFVFQTGDLPGVFRTLLFALTIWVSLALLSRKLIINVDMHRYGIAITYMRFFQTHTQNFLWNEVEAIEVLTQGGKGGGAFYKLLVGGKKIEFLTIPVLQMNKGNVLSMNDFFKKVSGKEVAVKGVYK